ncbi:MFS transporter [Actinomadura yumaensis]|uniref:MFS transporter n=1 Tax=Actinomadura yumaensis TaxID=111807 RepID=UPI00361AF844
MELHLDVRARGLAVVLLVCAVFAERFAREPILPPRLFRNRTFVLGSIASLCMGIAMFGGMIYLPQYLQIVKGMSPTASGLMTLPMVIGMFITSTASGQIVTRTGRYKIFPVVGLAFVAGAMFLLSQLHTDSSKVLIGADVAVLGVGLGLTLQILILAAQNAAEPADLAATTSGISFFRNLGGAMGVAAFGAILSNRLSAELKDALASAHVRPPSGTGTALGSPDAIHALPEPFKGLVLESFTKALETVFMVGVPIAVVGFLVVLFLKELPLRGSAARQAAKGGDPAATAPQGQPPAAGDGTRAASSRTGCAATRSWSPSRPSPRPPTAPVPGGTRATLAPWVTGRARNPFRRPRPRARARPRRRRPRSLPRTDDVDAERVRLVRERRAVPRGRRRADPRPRPQRRRHARPVRRAHPDRRGRAPARPRDHPVGRPVRAADPGPGTYVLIAATGEHEPQAATLVVGDRPVDFDLLLAGNGGLAGTVRSADGSPIEGAMVVVTDVRGEVVGTGRTGAGGEYAFKDVVSGTYTLAVSAAAHRPVALPVEVVGNGQSRHDVHLPAGSRVRGTVRDEAGEPVGDARVTLVDAAGNVVAMMITGPDGEYAFTDLTGGQYTVIASGYPPVATALSLSGGGQDGHDLKLGYPDE